MIRVFPVRKQREILVDLFGGVAGIPLLSYIRHALLFIATSGWRIHVLVSPVGDIIRSSDESLCVSHFWEDSPSVHQSPSGVWRWTPSDVKVVLTALVHIFQCLFEIWC